MSKAMRPSEDARAHIVSYLSRHPDACFHVYECAAPDHSKFGERQYLAIGPGCTLKEPPAILPDTLTSLNHSFVHLGPLDTGTWDVVKNPTSIKKDTAT